MGNDGEGRDDDNSKINPERAPSHSIQRSFKHKKRSLNKNPRKVMDPGDLDGLLLLGYMLTDDDLWEVEKDEVEVEIPPKQKRVWVREWIKRRDSDTSNTMYKLQCEISELRDEFEFRSMLRMDEPQYIYLVEKVRPLIQKQRTPFRAPISAEEKVSLTLTYLAYGGTMGLMSRMFRLGRSTAHSIIDETCPAIHDVLREKYLATPRTQAAWEDIIRGFENRWNFPNCLGGLDGKHIRIHCPPDSGSLYYNYKGSFSVVLMALIDFNYQIRYLDVGCEGRVADGGIWRSCSFNKWMKSGSLNLPPWKTWPNGEEYGVQPNVIVADDAFAMTSTLLKPYSSRALTRNKRIFNYRLSRARRVTENAFGIMASRFRILLTDIYRSPDRVVDMCLCIGALHNYLRSEASSTYMGLGSVDTEDANHQVIEGEWRRSTQLQSVQPTHDRNASVDAKALRDNMAVYFAEGGGRVPWQEKAIE